MSRAVRPVCLAETLTVPARAMKPIDPESYAARLLRSVWLLPATAFAIVSILGLASWPFWANRFALQAVTRRAEVTVSVGSHDSVGLALPAGTELRVGRAGLGNADRPPELANLTTTENWVRLIADKETLDRIDLGSGATLALTTLADGVLKLEITGNGGITVTLSGEIRQIDNQNNTKIIAKTQHQFGWSLEPADQFEPLRLDLVGAGSIKGVALYDQPANALHFSMPREDPDDHRPPFQSEILSGRLQLLDVNKEVTLQPRELVWLAKVDAVIERLEWTSNGIEIVASGRARTIGTGPPRSGAAYRPDRELTPSVLDYLFGQHELKLVWGAAVALLAALWKARKWALEWHR